MQDFRMETFLEVCKQMNFTKAAEKLCITQPAVSQHIHYLEEYYGVKLFQYEGKKLLLTNEGKILLEAAITMKHDELHLKQAILECGGKPKILVFGATLTVGEYVIPKRLAKFLKAYRNVTVQMYIANTTELLQRINQGDIDFAIVEGYFPKTEYDYLVFSKENYIMIAGMEYPISDVITLEEMIKETLIVREVGSGNRDLIEKILEEKNMSLKDCHQVMEINSVTAIKYLVRENLGISMVYEAAVKRELAEKTLRRITCSGIDISHDFYFIWRKDSVFAEYYQQIYQMLRAGHFN